MSKKAWSVVVSIIGASLFLFESDMNLATGEAAYTASAIVSEETTEPAAVLVMEKTVSDIPQSDRTVVDMPKKKDASVMEEESLEPAVSEETLLLNNETEESETEDETDHTKKKRQFHLPCPPAPPEYFSPDNGVLYVNTGTCEGIVYDYTYETIYRCKIAVDGDQYSVISCEASKMTPADYGEILKYTDWIACGTEFCDYMRSLRNSQSGTLDGEDQESTSDGIDQEVM